MDLPWKYNPTTFRNNRKQAEERDRKLMEQLKDKGLYDLFMRQIDEMKAIGVLKKTDEQCPKRYLPLLAVTNLDREST